MKRVYVNERWCLGCHLCEYYCAFASTNEKDMVTALKNIKIHPLFLKYIFRYVIDEFKNKKSPLF